MSDLESYVKNKVINGHCDCMFLINTYQWEWTTIAALVAPRPLLFANSDHDRIFPMDGNRRIIGRLRQLYGWYGKPELVDEYVSQGDHEDRPDLRVAACQWINRHLRGDTGPAGEVDAAPLPGKELRVFPEDKDVPADALNGKIDETFVAKAEVKLPEVGKFEEWKKGLIEGLRAKSFRGFPERIPLAPPSIPFGSSFRPTRVLKTEAGMRAFLHGSLSDESKSTTVLVLGPDEERKLPEWAEELTKNSQVLFLMVRGGQADVWTRKSPPNYVERAHALLGRTVDEGRVWDVAAAVRYLSEQDKATQPLRVIGRGQAGVVAAYAALFEPSVGEVVLVDPPTSHRDGPIFLNVMRVLDVPETLGLLAPRPLTLVNAKDKAFERTAEIYKRAGAADKLSFK
jgi:hypothetical protein